MGLNLTGKPGLPCSHPRKGWSWWGGRFEGDGTCWEAMGKIKELGMKEMEVVGG